MPKVTKIQWSDATWNPIRGCSRVSEGCRNCYAEYISARFSKQGEAYAGLAIMTSQGPRWTNEIRLVHDMIDKPLTWKKPRLIFVNSMSDMFHEDVPEDFIQQIFEVMRMAYWHEFQILTKRSQRLLDMNDRIDWPDNVWMGVSVEDTKNSYRIDHLRDIDANIKFISAEPLIGPIRDINLRDIDWCIIGGESGRQARPINLKWIVDIIGACESRGIDIFVKQLGTRWAKANWCKDSKGGNMKEWPDYLQIRDYPQSKEYFFGS